MERQYVQIEKECLSFVFSCERFRQYLAGREEIFSGVRPQATADNFPEANAAEAPNIQPGGKIQAWWADVVADHLSRAPLPAREEIPIPFKFLLLNLKH